MANQNIPNPENIEAMRMQRPPTPDEVAAMNAAAREQIMGYNNQFDALLQRELNPDKVEVRAANDFNLQAGIENNVVGIDGQQIPKTEEQKDRLAYQLSEIEGGDKERIDRLARRMHAITDQVLEKYGVDATNIGIGKETVEKTMLAEAVTRMETAGGAKELDPTRTEQADRILRQEIGQEIVLAVDKDPGKLQAIYEDDPAKAKLVAEAVTAYRQNGRVNYRTTQELGSQLRSNSGDEYAAAA